MIFKKLFPVVFFCLAFVLLLTSCKKEDKCLGAAGGNLTLKVFLQHGDHAVVNLKNYRDTVYIKYNTKEYPGSDISKYDAIFIGDWPGDSVIIPNLQCGSYFIYGVGFESVHSYRVTGGIPVNTEQENGELSVTIPVSE